MKRTYKFTIILVLLILVMSGVIVWSFFRGTKLEESDVSTLSVASIPTITMRYEDMPLNCLQGYTCRLDTPSADAVLTPLESDGKLTFSIGDTDKKITAAEYSVYGKNRKDLVEERRIENISLSDGTSELTLDMSKSVTGKTEYFLEIRLETDEKETICYYTRLVRETDIDIKEALTFVTEFCKNTFDKNANDKITTYIEPDATGDNTTLSHINIHSSYEQVTWGDLKVQLLGEPVFNLLETGGSGAVLSVDYQVSHEEDEETNSYYLVHEYYRVRKSSYRMHLLEFEREMNQTFIGTRLAFGGQTIVLGILPKDVTYTYNEEGTLVCWEQAGELWQYDTEENRLNKIFSLQDTRREDKRSFMQNYSIRILKMDQNGDVDFVVSGYFNRGSYDGKVCAQLCHYTKKTNSYEVRYVMEDTRSEALLCADMAQLAYLSDNHFYFYDRGSIRRLDIAAGEVTDLAEGLQTETMAVSANNRYVSWTEDPDRSERIFTMDLNSEKITEITGDQGEYLRPIGYVGEDFVYGKAKSSAVKAGASGEFWFPMYKVMICDKDGNVIKDYTDEALPVTGGVTTSSMITLWRVSLAAGGMDYIAASPHQIVSSSEQEQTAVMQETVSDDEKQKQRQLKFAKGHAVPSVHLYTAEETGYLKPIAMETGSGSENEGYYVYTMGRLAGRFRLSRDAFSYVSENGGIMKDASQQTLYYKSVQGTEYTMSSEPEFPAAILQNLGTEAYPGIAEAWRQASGKQVLDATGVSLDTARYMAADDYQVLLRTAEAGYGLITGFTKEEITLYDPVTGQSAQMPLQQAEDAYRQFGSVCIVCK